MILYSIFPHNSNLEFKLINKVLTKKEVSNIEIVNSMEGAVRASYRLGDKGDVVLLSPTCASFDLFKNFEDRGQSFKDQVRKL